MKTVLACVVLLACGGGAGAAPTTTATLPKTEAPKTYAIHLSRPNKVGDKIHMVIDHSEDKALQVTVGGKPGEEQHDKHVLHIDTISTITGVDERGRPTTTHEDVKDFSVDGHSLGPASLDVTRARKLKDAVVLVNGKPAAKKMREMLGDLLKLSVGGPEDDEVFGTKAMQAAGSHWTVNTKLAQDDLRDNNGLDTSSLTGDAWLEGTTRVGDRDCLDVRAKMSFDVTTVPDLPPGQKVESGHTDIDLRAALPIDGKIERASEHMGMVMAMKLSVQSPKGPTLVAVTVTESRDGAYSPVAP